MEIMLKSKIVREIVKAKSYDLDKVETGKKTIGEALWRLLEKLADDKTMGSNSGNDGPEVTIMKREETHDVNSTRAREPENKEIVQSLVERIQENLLWSGNHQREMVKKKISRESGGWDEGSEKNDDEQNSLCMILAEEKRRYDDRELQTDTLSGTYNLEYHDVNRGEELEMIAVSRKPFGENQTSGQIWNRRSTGRT